MENINCIAVIRKQNTEKFTQSDPDWQYCPAPQDAAMSAHRPIFQGAAATQANATALVPSDRGDQGCRNTA